MITHLHNIFDHIIYIYVCDLVFRGTVMLRKNSLVVHESPCIRVSYAASEDLLLCNTKKDLGQPMDCRATHKLCFSLSVWCFAEQVQDLAIRCIQKNIQKNRGVKHWPWWKLFTNVRPLIEVQLSEDQIRGKDVSPCIFLPAYLSTYQPFFFFYSSVCISISLVSWPGSTDRKLLFFFFFPPSYPSGINWAFSSSDGYKDVEPPPHTWRESLSARFQVDTV